MGKEGYSLYWLANAAKIDVYELWNILDEVRRGKLTYLEKQIPKSGSGVRKLFVPPPILCRVQRALNKHVLNDLSLSPGVFGFSGGSIVDAIIPHLESGVMLSFDIVNAFGNTTNHRVLNSLIGNRNIFYENGELIHEYGPFSWYVAHILTDLTTWRGVLPQGAPTSPRLFDKAFEPIDESILRLLHTYTEKEGTKKKGIVAKVTRYADNFAISLQNTNYFPPKLRRHILEAVRAYGYNYHEDSIRHMQNGKATRMLGLNIINRHISAPRGFKRNIRLTLHHLRYFLDHNLPVEEIWLRLRGQMAFGRLGELPDSLINTYISLEEEIEELYGV